MSRPLAYLASRYPYLSQTFVLREVEALRRRGVDVRTFSVRAPDPSAPWSAADRRALETTAVVVPPSAGMLLGAVVDALRHPAAVIDAFRYALARSAPGLRGRTWSAMYVGEALLLRVHLRRQGVHHVHAHLANVAADVARLVARYGNRADGGGWRWSWTMHGPTEFGDVERFDLRGKVEDADLVVCISDFCRSQLMALVEETHWDRLAVVHCGVAPGDFPYLERRADRGPFRIVCVGQLLARKGQSVLVEAVARLIDEGVDVVLDLVGDGPDRRSLERLVARLGIGAHVRLHGAVGQDEILHHYADADVFCLPSFAEGVPVVLMEAMATGLPVVATPIAGVSELVEHGVTGVLVRPGRPDLLTDTLHALAKDPDLRSRLGKGGRRRVLDEFDVDRAAAALDELFASLD